VSNIIKSFFLQKKEKEEVKESKDKKIVASITVTVSIADHDNVLGQALLDYITNNPGTKHIAYNKRTFLLNQNDVITLDDDLYVRMTETTTPQITAQSEPNIVQILEVFSYRKSLEMLRALLEKLQGDYV
jgi:hypothetical protein